MFHPPDPAHFVRRVAAVAACGVVVLLVLAGCGGGEPDLGPGFDDASAEAAPACAAVFDVSRSTTGVEDVLQGYAEAFTDFVRRCAAEGATLTLVAATDDSRQDASLPQELDLSPPDVAGLSEDDASLEQEARIAEVVQQAAALLNEVRSDGDGTDLVGAFAEIATAVDDGAQVRVYSDALQWTDDLNLGTTDLSEEGVLDLVAEQDALGMVPRLPRAQWAFVGAGRGAGAEMLATEQLLGLERFWRAWVEVSEGGLESFGATSPDELP